MSTEASHFIADAERHEAEVDVIDAAPASPPVGRNRIGMKPAFQAPDPEPNYPESPVGSTEHVTDDGEVIQAPAQTAAPDQVDQAKADADQMAVQDTIDNLANQIREAETTKGLEVIGRYMVAATKAIGQDNYDALQLIYRERYKALKQAKQ